MAKVKPKDVPKEERLEMIGEFFDVVVGLKTKKEVIDFFVGMMTPSEALMFARRMQIAKYLLKDCSYDYITDSLGVGKGTVSQVDKWLFERDGAYKNILEKYLSQQKTKGSENKFIKKNNSKKVSPKNNNINEQKKVVGLDRYPGHLLAKQLLGLDYFSN